MNTIKVPFVFIALLLTQLVWAQTSPIPMLEHAADEIITTLKKNKAHLNQNHQVIYDAVEHNLLPIVDVVGMSRSALGRNAWHQATTAEKKAFMRAFTRLVIRTYANPLAEYTDERVKFLPQRGEPQGRFTRVKSVILRSNGPDIPLNYSLVQKKGKWKIYDLSVEGVSLLQSFRSQFKQALQNTSIHELIEQMNRKKVS